MVSTGYNQLRMLLGRYLSKMRGNGRSTLKVNMLDVLTSLAGAFLTIFVLIWLTGKTSAEWLMAPFGASCVLAFSLWNAPLSQPRNIVGGHIISAFVGLAVMHGLGIHSWSIGLAVGLAIAAMMLTKTTHPPAGANPLVVMLGGYSWDYLITPVLVGSLVIVGIALCINNLRRDRQYPTFWL